MAVVFSDTSTLQGLVQHLRFTSGQDSLDIEDATRLLNFALDDYAYLALTSSGRWKFDDLTHVNGSGDETFPTATATLSADEESVPLESSFLMVNQVEVTDDNGKYKILDPTDIRDHTEETLSVKYETNGEPKLYDYDAHSIFFYPRSDTSRTVRIFYSRASPYFDTTDTTATVGIPRIHHHYLALNAADKLADRLNDNNAPRLHNKVLEEENKIRDFFSKRDQDTPRKLTAIINVPE